MEQTGSDHLFQNEPGQDWTVPPAAPAPGFPTGKRELIFGALVLVFGMLLCNSVLFGGLNLGFALFTVICTVCSVGYLLGAGCKLKAYPGVILGLCLVIAAAFARSDDSFVKIVMLCFLAEGINLGLCLTAGKNCWQPGGFTSLLDGPRTAFIMGFDRWPESFRGIGKACRHSGNGGKKSLAVLLGLGVALLLLCVMIPLLTTADAAFEGLVSKLPQLDITEIIVTLVFGSVPVCYLYSRGVALRHDPKENSKVRHGIKGISPLTVNTVLAVIDFVYLVYLISQLAYLAGGFAGILPAEFTMAEYARRGFFEMAMLCAINLGIIALSVGVVAKKDRAPVSCRLLCLFLAAVTEFLVVTASARMWLYIGSYGLTRLRVLTEVVTVFFGIATLLVAIWLFVPRLPYMKAIFLAALIMGGAVIWADVDTVVARYNVTAYQTGKLETVDVEYLAWYLGDGAVPYLVELTHDTDPEVAAKAEDCLRYRGVDHSDDIREWNYVNRKAEELLNGYSE